MPTGAMAAILMSIAAQYGMSGVFAATVLAGVLLILAGIFHLGRVTAYLPMPVITGFTSGIAVVIALGQVDNFFGPTSQGSTAVEKLLHWLTNGIFQINLGAVTLGLFVVLLAPAMAQIPLSALAGVLMVTAWRMNEWKTIRYLFSHRFKDAILKFGATMAAAVLFD